MTAISYLVTPADHVRIDALLAVLVPDLPETDRWEAFANATNWTPEVCRDPDAWPANCTLSSDHDREAAWREAHPGLSGHCPGIHTKARRHRNRLALVPAGLADLVVAGLSLDDRTYPETAPFVTGYDARGITDRTGASRRASIADLSIDAIRTHHTDLDECLRAECNLVSSSLDSEAIAPFRLLDLDVLISPRNAADMMHLDHADDGRWIRIAIRPDRAFRRRLHHAQATGREAELVSELYGAGAITRQDIDTLRASLPGDRRRVLVSHTDRARLDQRDIGRIDDCLLVSYLPSYSLTSDATDDGGSGALRNASLEMARSGDGAESAIPVEIRILRLIAYAGRMEARHRPPGAMRAALEPLFDQETGTCLVRGPGDLDRLPYLSGPQIAC